MNYFAVILVAVCVRVPSSYCASNPIEWCYNDSTCNDLQWATIVPLYCNGTRQSPVNIVSASVTENANLTALTFEGFGNTSAMNFIQNTGKTVQVTFKPGVKISAGDLPATYDTLQLHLHWGNGTAVPGAEHTVDGKRYPMEARCLQGVSLPSAVPTAFSLFVMLHIVNSKLTYNRNTTLAFKDSLGFAALGFFIEELTGTTGQPASWKILTSLLANISVAGQSVEVPAGISLDDLLVGVDRTKYYRYLGSLTNPNCNEAVIWTVFKDTIKVSKDLIDLFSTSLHINDGSSPLMVNVYRSIQPAQPVSTQPKSSSTRTGFSLGLMVLCLVLRWI
nr:carbonic anhydrase 4 isoform X1 [Nothobranchius furzeri]